MMTRVPRSTCRSRWIGGGLLLCAALASAAELAVPTADAKGYPVPPALGDTVFSALAPGPDGYVYMGACNSKGPAHLVRLDPKTGKIVDLGNMQDVTGEHDPELIPQSKIHTQLALDGKWI